MEGYEAFKQLRKEKGCTVNEFACQMSISSTAITFYEDGKRPLTSVSVDKAIRMFDFLGEDIRLFYETYYPYEHEVDMKVAEWQKAHPPERFYFNLKQQLWVRLSKIKKRGSIPESEFEDIYHQFTEAFQMVNIDNDTGNVTSESYSALIMPLLGRIRNAVKKTAEIDDKMSRIIMQNICSTELPIAVVAEICGMTYSNLKNCIDKGTDTLKKMRIISALKLCYLLELDFRETFDRD